MIKREVDLECLPDSICKQFSVGHCLKDNWDRIRELMYINNNYSGLYGTKKAELDYRIAIQNAFANTGEFDLKGYITARDSRKREQ